uniref:Glutamyl-tRNA amidotransferase subunit C n=1 Tax=Aegilops tauschii subsp. strangulata TaxID=200361 RepID=A0A453LPU8_AEGTS
MERGERQQWIIRSDRLWSKSKPLLPFSIADAAPTVGPGPLEPPDLPRLANSARISLSPQEAEEFAPKIQQVVDWFGQLQAVDLESIEPSLRAGTHPCNSSHFHVGWLAGCLSLTSVLVPLSRKTILNAYDDSCE